MEPQSDAGVIVEGAERSGGDVDVQYLLHGDPDPSVGGEPANAATTPSVTFDKGTRKVKRCARWGPRARMPTTISV
jgi:hypothetical protein